MNRKEVKQTKEKGRVVTKDGEDLTFMVSGGAVILAFVLLYNVNYAGFMQNTTLIRALTERSDSGASYNLGLFKDTIGYNSFGTAEVREQLASFSTDAFDTSKGISDEQNQFLAYAKEQVEKQAAGLPADARSQLFAGSFLSRIGKSEEALPYLEKAREDSPTKQTILFALATNYYRLKNTEKAEEIFKQAYELAPEDVDAEKSYLQILLANGKRSEAKKILTDRPVAGITL